MPAPNPEISKPKSGIGTKVVVISVLVLVLYVLSAMISSLIRERTQRRDGAIEEISAKWGSAQTLGGPLLIIPYRVTQKIEEDKKTRYQTNIYYATFLPDSLLVSGTVEPEIRYRGIYEAVLYSSRLKVSGEFPRPDFSKLHIADHDVLWNEASLSLGISDLRGIRDSAKLAWNGKTLPFGPGGGEGFPFTAGIHVKGVPIIRSSRFSIDLLLNGSRGLSFLPLGRKTTVSLSSPWASPGFDGEFLPISRDINAQGFKASWEVLELARPLPQAWTGYNVSADALNKSSFGVNLVMPAGAYQQNDRAINYAILFIILSFTAFFLFEILGGLRLHFLQYSMVGSALVVFYLLLLSISEHIGFGKAYLLASSVTTLLVGGYCRSTLGQGGRALLMSSLLAGLYSFLYVVLQLEDYALLMGSCAIFAALALVMWLTRRVDWFDTGKKK